MTEENVSASPDRDADGLALSALESRVTQAHEKLRELEKARRSARHLRYAISLTLLLAFFGWVYAIVAHVSAFDTEAFTAELSGRAERVLPKVSATVGEVLEEVTPVFARALDDKLREASPRVARKIEDESESLRQNVERGLDKRLRAALSAVASAQREELARAFPELAGQPEMLDRMMASVQDGFQAWVARQLTTTLNEHVNALLDIKETLASFESPGATREVSAEEVLGLWLEIVYERMGGDETLTPTPNDAVPVSG